MTTQEKCYIRWKTTPIDGGLYALQITEQSHLGFFWKASDYTKISSREREYPHYACGGKLLTVWGTGLSDDDHLQPIILTPDQLADCERALTEYNFAHSSFAAEYDVIGYRRAKPGESCFSPQTTGVFSSCGDSEHTYLILDPKKSDEDKAREAFAASVFAKDYDAIAWRIPAGKEHTYECGSVWYNRNGCVPYTNKPILILARKQQPAPTGEACVGCLCWVWDEGYNEKTVRVITRHKEKCVHKYVDDSLNMRDNAIPLTPDEVVVYLEKAKKAWGK